MSVILALGRLRQEDREFEASLGLKPFGRPCLKKKKKKKSNWHKCFYIFIRDVFGF
jgi:hypothetical protein